MNKTLFAALAALAAVTVAGAALPAAAQDHGRPEYGHPEYRHPDYGRPNTDSTYDADRDAFRDRSADRWDRRGGYMSVNARQAELERRIAWGFRRGALDHREAFRLQAEARDIARLEAGYRFDGMTARERYILDRRLDDLEMHIARETRDRDYGWGYGRR